MPSAGLPCEQSHPWEVVGEEEQQGDRECWRVELGGLILHIVNHYLQHNLFLFSRGFTGTRSEQRMRSM